MPCLLRAVGGTEKHVGLAVSLPMLGYSIFLATANRNHHLNGRTATRTAAAMRDRQHYRSLVSIPP